MLVAEDIRIAAVKCLKMFGGTKEAADGFSTETMPRKLKEIAAFLGSNDFIANNKVCRFWFCVLRGTM